MLIGEEVSLLLDTEGCGPRIRQPPGVLKRLETLAGCQCKHREERRGGERERKRESERQRERERGRERERERERQRERGKESERERKTYREEKSDEERQFQSRGEDCAVCAHERVREGLTKRWRERERANERRKCVLCGGN